MITIQKVVKKINTITMVYWKENKFWLGKILEHPEMMTQGLTLEELEENINNAYRLMIMEDVPQGFQIKEIAICNAGKLSALKIPWPFIIAHIHNEDASKILLHCEAI